MMKHQTVLKHLTQYVARLDREIEDLDGDVQELLDLIEVKRTQQESLVHVRSKVVDNLNALRGMNGR